MTNEDYQNFPNENEGPNFRSILDQYLLHWKWFAACVLFAIVVALIYLQFTQNSYLAAATIIIKDEKAKGPSAEESGFAGISLLGGISTSSIENELGLLRSKRLMNNSVKALNLNIQYMEKDGLFKKELYNKSPYFIRPVSIDEKALFKAKLEERNSFTIDFVSENKVTLRFDDDEKTIANKLGGIVTIDFAKFYIEPNPEEEYTIENQEDVSGIRVVFNTVNSASAPFRAGLNAELVDENSTLIQISVQDPIKKKAEDVIDQLIFEYNKEAIEDKDLIAQNTKFFIDERLAIINSELDSVETGKEEFKTSNLLTDIETKSQLIVQNVSDYNIQEQEISTELELTRALIDHLKTNISSLLPTNLGIEDSGTNSLIEEFNSNVLKRNRLLKSAGAQNPIIVGLTNEIDQIRENVMSSLKRRHYNLNIKKKNLDRQSGVLTSEISDVPSQERAYRGIERQQNIKEALYLFLLKKREENSLALAAEGPKAKLVDKAYSNNIPISPNSKIVLSIAFLMGLFIPFAAINIMSILNNKITKSDDVGKLAKTSPFFGELPHLTNKQKTTIKTYERSVLGESFNILSSNIQHYLENKLSTQGCSCIFVTSSIKGEGKTFTAINLGISLSTGGKKVLVIGADLRNPQLHHYQNVSKTTPGLTDYLIDSTSTLNGYVQDTNENPNLKFLYTGSAQNNPSELLQKPKVTEMFIELKKHFDYIIVDTAPALQLADTSIISKYADVTIYMLRASYTKKEFITFGKDAESMGRLKNIGFVLNDVKLNNTLYGNSYNYGE